ncbi:MAG: long-chain fatty acid--CoA ligase [Chloroflexi bacterium]|nr:long-chain fatty acid--CoA ligase [Chloroflexota bacterium]
MSRRLNAGQSASLRDASKDDQADFTTARLLRVNRDKWPDKVWMRKKELGFWKSYTWKEGYERVKHFSLGLIALGFQRGEVMAIIGDNDPHWFWAELAAQAAGGAVTGVFSSSSPNEVKYLIQHSDSTFVVAQDEEQVDKILAIKGDLPLVKKVIYWDSKGLKSNDDELLASFDMVVQAGEGYERDHPRLFEENISRGRWDDVALIMYTSGTTGLPKGAVMTHGNLFSANSIFYSVNPISEKDEWVSFILPGWMAEQGLGLMASLQRGLRMSFPESQATVQENIREIGASILMYPSRLWETMGSEIQNRMAEATFLKRLIYRLCLPMGYKAADAKFRGDDLGLFWRGLYGLSKLFFFDQLRDKLGLLKLRYAFTAGSLLGPEVFRLMTAIGVDIRQLYGSSELGISQHMSGDVKVDSVGRVYPGTIVRIMDDNHILARGQACSASYYKNPQATEEAFAGGWYHTGDAGHMDEDGHMYYLDRLQYMRQLAGGTRFAPQYIESRLKFSQYIRDVFVVGDETREFIVAVVNINYDNVGHWAEGRRIPYTTFADLSQKPEVCRLIGQEVANLNDRLPQRQRIRRYVNMPKEFDPDEAELTRTMKLRRGLVEERYRSLIEALYGDRERVVMEVPVLYRDGRQGVVTAEIQVNELH